jgi:outer membrane lipoprotein-sorting protein
MLALPWPPLSHLGGTFGWCVLLVFLSACQIDNEIQGEIGDFFSAIGPKVSVSSPSPSSGDSAATFSFQVTYSGADTINLTSGNITVNTTGPSCDTPIVTNGTTSTPTVTLTNCTGNGTVGITVAASTSSDEAGNQNSVSSASATATISNPISCPTGYIPVVADGVYTFSDFCVMKYEAKLSYDTDGDSDFSNATIVADGNVSNTYDYDTDYDTPANLVKYKAVSDASGRPWVRIKRGENGAASGQGALEACQYLNTQESVSNKYDIISNDEWQTIARNIAAQQSGLTNNWGTDSNGDVVLNHGHADNSPSQSCDASNEYVQTDCADSGSESKFEEKRTHYLSNGEVIWDFAGNVWEWLKDNNSTTVYTGAGNWDYWTDWTDTTPNDGISDSYAVTQALFGPLDLTPAICTNPNANNYCGFGYLYDGSAGTVLRGAGWSYGTDSGVFSSFLYGGPSNSLSGFGFRCVYKP